jgi:hypothetical protein
VVSVDDGLTRQDALPSIHDLVADRIDLLPGEKRFIRLVMVMPKRATARFAAQDRRKPEELGRVKIELVAYRPKPLLLRAFLVLQRGGEPDDVDPSLETDAEAEI